MKTFIEWLETQEDYLYEANLPWWKKLLMTGAVTAGQLLGGQFGQAAGQPKLTPEEKAEIARLETKHGKYVFKNMMQHAASAKPGHSQELANTIVNKNAVLDNIDILKEKYKNSPPNPQIEKIIQFMEEVSQELSNLEQSYNTYQLSKNPKDLEQIRVNFIKNMKDRLNLAPTEFKTSPDYKQILNSLINTNTELVDLVQETRNTIDKLTRFALSKMQK